MAFSLRIALATAYHAKEFVVPEHPAARHAVTDPRLLQEIR
jgi:hypothetical protein